MPLPEDEPAPANMQTDVMYLLRLFAGHRSDHKILVIDCSLFADNRQWESHCVIINDGLVT